MARDGKSTQVAGGRISVRAGRLIVAFKDTAGVWHQHRTKLQPGQERAAEALLAEIREALEKGTTWTAGPPTVRSFAERWIEGRKHLSAWRDDWSRLEQHVFPTIGSILLADVRPRHLRALVQALRVKLAQPRNERTSHGCSRRARSEASMAPWPRSFAMPRSRG